MKVRISDMMDCINDDSVSIQGNEIASIDRIKELTMRRIEKESNVTSLKPRKISRVGIIVAVLVVSMLFTGSVFAYITWEGYANTSEMSESEKEFFLKDSIAVAGELVDSEGNVHYLDASGKETMVLSKEEAAAYEKERLENMEKEVQESTQLVDVGTLASVPNGITEVQVNKDGGFDDFYLIDWDGDISTLKLQYSEVESVRWAGRREILSMIADGSFVPYYPSLINMIFDMKASPIKYGAHFRE